MSFQDILFDKRDGVAYITINRPEVLNAFRMQTLSELMAALAEAASDPAIGVIVLAGAGERAFCTGRDNRTVGEPAGHGPTGDDLYTLVRDIPKPVIARVQGYAIGGGNVLNILCDLTIASEQAIFGQVGPSVGAVDPGFGTAYLAHAIGEKKAREMWYLCARYTAREALAMGLCNIVVPPEDLDKTVDAWCQTMLAKSPTALAIAKRSFNAATEQFRGIGFLGKQALQLYRHTNESKEGTRAFLEKRKPDFRAARMKDLNAD